MRNINIMGVKCKGFSLIEFFMKGLLKWKKDLP